MKKKQRILYKKILIVVFLILLVILIRAVFNAKASLSNVEERQQLQAEEFEEADGRIQYLQDRIDYLDTEEGLEQELLETFPVKRPGEEVIILVEKDDTGAGFLQLEEKEERSWWQFWR